MNLDPVILTLFGVILVLLSVSSATGAVLRMVINDAEGRVTLAYMMNRMAPSIIGGPVIAQLAALAFALPVLAARRAR